MTLIAETMQIQEGFPTVDLQTGANNGDWVSLKNYKHVGILFRSGVGTAGDDPTVVVQQASDVAGTGAKALNINTSKIFKKQAATSHASTGQWSDASAGVTTNSWTDAAAAEQVLTLLIEFDADELDVDNGFDCIRATIADVGGNAQPGDLLYLLTEPRYPSQPTELPSAIVD